MNVVLLNGYNDTTDTCAEAAAVCRDSEPTPELLDRVLVIGHDSILEFADFTFKITDVSRALTHQLVRHRIASYAQQSQRHVRIKEGIWYFVPDSIAKDDNLLQDYLTFMNGVQQLYDDLVQAGIPKEDARYILPNATYSTIVVKMNARALQNFFRERCCNRSQHEIRDLAKRMLRLCRIYAPQLFLNPYPDCGSCKEPCLMAAEFPPREML